MIKKGILTLLPFFVIALVLSLISAFSTTEKIDQTSAYSVSSYEINAVVKENNSIEIDEIIDVKFNFQSHGIFRYIPLYETVKFNQDGKLYSKNYKVQVEVNKSKTDKFESYVENDSYVIQLGDPNSFANENSTYHINYTISLGDDKISDFDQLYYNFIGTGWDTTLSNISINILFEKPIENREINFYVGTQSEDEVVTSTIANNQVSFVYSGTLFPFKGITARAVLDEGYFKTEKQSIVPSVAIFGSAIMLFLITFVALFINRKRKKIVPIVEFSAPENITPSDAGYIIDSKVNNGDVSALIVYWASKGFIKIDETTKETILIKNKDADESFKNYEKRIFETMFEEGNEFKISNVNEKVAREISNARQSIKEENSKFFNKKVLSRKSFLIILFAVLFGVFLSQISNVVSYNLSTTVIVCVSVMIAAIGFAIIAVKDQQLTFGKGKFWAFIVLLSFAYIAICAPFGYFLFEPYSDPLLTSIFVPVFIFVSIFTVMNLNAREEGENKEVGRIFGLRTFILTTEKDRIEVLAKDNPELFFDVLPYAYVLGISDVWIDKFKTIEVQAPEWYVGNVGIVDVLIASRVLSTMNSISASIAQSIAKSVASSASKVGKLVSGKGGGFSGGGFGGGGGGRW